MSDASQHDSFSESARALAEMNDRRALELEQLASQESSDIQKAEFNRRAHASHNRAAYLRNMADKYEAESRYPQNSR